MTYPNNRLIVNGVDLTDTFKMVLADGFLLEPPSPKTYTVDIPGGNGVLDLTESLLGDTAYGNRVQEFTFYLINTTEFEKVKTQVSNLLHGRAFNYTLTFDPGYTYRGRFSVSSYDHSAMANGIVGVITISIDADPYKHKAPQNYAVNAVGGVIRYFESGRERVRPTITTNSFLTVIFDMKQVNLPAGTWTLNDLFFTSGLNEIYLNSYPIYNLMWGDLITNNTTWGGFKTRRLFEWYKLNGDETFVSRTWNDVSSSRWGELSIIQWSDMTYIAGGSEGVDDVIVKYDWGDL